MTDMASREIDSGSSAELYGEDDVGRVSCSEEKAVDRCCE
jgi:hypothetical protein